MMLLLGIGTCMLLLLLLLIRRGGSAKTLNETSEFEERRDKNVLSEMHIDRTLVALLRRI